MDKNIESLSQVWSNVELPINKKDQIKQLNQLQSQIPSVNYLLSNHYQQIKTDQPSDIVTISLLLSKYIEIHNLFERLLLSLNVYIVYIQIKNEEHSTKIGQLCGLINDHRKGVGHKLEEISNHFKLVNSKDKDSGLHLPFVAYSEKILIKSLLNGLFCIYNAIDAIILIFDKCNELDHIDCQSNHNHSLYM